ncbi:MAG: hypothetical protein ABJL99_18075 [Aliishimia sp.]
MIRNLVSISALVALVACGDGSPFNNDVTDSDDGTSSDIPEEIASSVTGFTYNPGEGTMTLSGTLRDGDEVTSTFFRQAALDSGPYQAYTLQDDPLDEHTTVYVRTVADVTAGVAVTGGQFTYYSGGANYGRSGGFEAAPVSEANDTGLVTYSGEYVGLTNLNGPENDTLPITDPDIDVNSIIIPRQAGVVTGNVIINVSFDDNNLAGAITDRRVNSKVFGEFNVSDLVLVPTELTSDGTFVGEVELPFNRIDVGGYGGVIGSNQGEALAGGIFAEDHFDDTLDDAGVPIIDPVTGAQAAIAGEEEFGIFVLGRCGGASEDTSAVCDIVDPL